MASKISVLIIEDEPDFRQMLSNNLSNEYQPLEADTAKEGLRLTSSNNPQLILLDLGLPDTNGVSLTQHIRSFSETPIIVLSSWEKEDDKVAALDAGANDYLTKPFGMAELHARMRVALRASKTVPTEGCIQFGNVRINLETREIFKEDKQIHLTPTEYQLILYMVQHSGKVVTHKQVLSKIWGQAYVDQTQYLRVFMGQLRHKIEDDPARPRHLLTEVAVGYRFRE